MREAQTRSDGAWTARLRARRTVFNGNGKLPWELRLAVEQGVLINVDSEFDLDNIAAAAEAAGKTARVLIRINPDVDPEARARRPRPARATRWRCVRSSRMQLSAKLLVLLSRSSLCSSMAGEARLLCRGCSADSVFKVMCWEQG